jgi:hypothetical protein
VGSRQRVFVVRVLDQSLDDSLNLSGFHPAARLTPYRFSQQLRLRLTALHVCGQEKISL